MTAKGESWSPRERSVADYTDQRRGVLELRREEKGGRRLEEGRRRADSPSSLLVEWDHVWFRLMRAMSRKF